jgi:hypothetical protein
LPVPGARPGGRTRDLAHRFNHEIFQLNGGQQSRYVVGSDAAGLSMGVYDTTALPIYRYLHGPGHPKCAIRTTSSRPRSEARSSTISG